MQVITSLYNTSLPPSVATIGFFDGVHLGHQYLIDQVIKEADKKKLASTIITFSDHPSKVIHEKKIELLTPLDEKLSHLTKRKVDYCVVLPFTEALANLSAYEFMTDILKNKLNVASLYIGYDNRFGHNREKGFADYIYYGKKIGINVIESQALFLNKKEISSSLIRALLKEGNIQSANEYLGYHYSLEGTINNGKKIGRTLGFPTANIEIGFKNKLTPLGGVYATKVKLGESLYKGMLNIGYRPTIKNGKQKTIEVHILDFNQNIYGKTIQIIFNSYLRKEIQFKDKESLIKQLNQDEENVRAFFQK